VDAAARLLQRKYRARYGRARFKALQEVIRITKAKAEAEAALKDGKNWGPQRVRDYSGIDPKLKIQHGKRRIFESAKGWGHYVNDEFIPAPPELTDAHVSRTYTDTLDKSPLKFTGGDITDAINAIDTKHDHILGGGKKGNNVKRFN
jgi:hypothetical protein